MNSYAMTDISLPNVPESRHVCPLRIRVEQHRLPEPCRNGGILDAAVLVDRAVRGRLWMYDACESGSQTRMNELRAGMDGSSH